VRDTRRGDEGLAAGQRPFGPGFGPILAARLDVALGIGPRQAQRPLGPRDLAGSLKPGLDGFEIGFVTVTG
jgi:hypothetical protein